MSWQIFYSRMMLAWWFQVLPWKVPHSAIKYLALTAYTPKDIERTHELAKRFGWGTKDDKT